MAQPLGEQLRELREKASLSIEELAGRTKVPSRYLRFLEKEEYEKLPPPVYIRGFLQRWAKATGGDSEKLSQQFYRENKFLVNTYSRQKVQKSARGPRFVLTFRPIVGAVAVIALVSLLGYIYYNQFVRLSDPRVEITQPVEVSSVSDERIAPIRGNLRSVERLFINGQSVPTQGDSFSYEYELSTGLNTISIVAEGSKQRVEIVRNIIYAPNEN